MDSYNKTAENFVAYEYKEILVNGELVSMYLDCYKNFGWFTDENIPSVKGNGRTVIRLKRDRKLINKMELTRLQRHFEASMNEIQAMEKSKTQAPMMWALTAGIIGTAFIAGSTFAVTHDPPVIWLCIVLAVPGFMGWFFPYFIYHNIARKRKQKIQPLIEAKYEEVYQICEKGYALL